MPLLLLGLKGTPCPPYPLVPGVCNSADHTDDDSVFGNNGAARQKTSGPVTDCGAWPPLTVELTLQRNFSVKSLFYWVLFLWLVHSHPSWHYD